MANKITRANAGGPRQLALWTRWAARVVQFLRWVGDLTLNLDIARITIGLCRRKS